MARHRDRRGRFAGRSRRRVSRRRHHTAKHTAHASHAAPSATRGGFMGISPMVWIVLLGGAAVLWWSKSRTVSLPAPARPSAPTGAARAIPQSLPTPISAAAQPADVVPAGNVPGSIWV